MCRRTPLIFVDSIAEIFGALTSGKLLFVPPRNAFGRIDMSRLAWCVGRHQVTHITILPSQLHLLLNQISQALGCSSSEPSAIGSACGRTEGVRDDGQVVGCSGHFTWTALRVVFVSGEPCSLSTVQLFHKLVCDGVLPSAVQLVNLYGSTEVAGDVSVSVLCEAGHCLVDLTPVAHTRVCSAVTASTDGPTTVVGTVSSTDVSVSPITSGRLSFVPIASGIIAGNIFFIAARSNRDCADESHDVNSIAVDIGGEGEYRSVTEGAVGELLVSGCHVADGYVTCSNATANISYTDSNMKFIRRPMTLTSGYCGEPIQRVVVPSTSHANDDDLLYCTGDLVRIVSVSDTTEEGNGVAERLHIQLIGRSDLQVKAKGGIRISLLDMETTLKDTFQHGLSTDDADSVGVEMPTVICTTCDVSLSRQYANGDAIIVAFVDRRLVCSAISGSLGVNGRDLVDACAGGDAAAMRMVTTACRDLLLSRAVPSSFLPDFIVSMPEGVVYRTPVTGKLDRQKYVEEANRLFKMLSTNRHPGNISTTDDKFRPGSDTSAQLTKENVTAVLAASLPGLTSVNASLSLDASLLEWSFMALGGDSMSAEVVRWQLETKFGVKLTVSDLMQKSVSDIVDFVLNFATTSAMDSHVTVDKLSGTNKRKNITESTDKRSAAESFAHIDKRICIATDAELPIAETVERDCDLLSDDGQGVQYFTKGRAVSLTKCMKPLQNVDDCKEKGSAGFAADIPTDASRETRFNMTHIWKQSLRRCVDSTPLVASVGANSIAFAASHGGTVSAVSANGIELWKVELGENVHIEGGLTSAWDSPLCIRNQSPIVNSSDSADVKHGLQKRDSKLVAWPLFVATYKARDVDRTSPDISSSSEHGISSTHAPAVGRVWCLNSSTGRVVWHTGDHIIGEVKGAPVVCQLPAYNREPSLSTPFSNVFVDVVLVGSHDGNMYVFCARSGALLGRRQCGIGSLFSSPIILNRRLLVSGGTGDVCPGDTQRAFQLDVCVCSTSGRVQSVGVYLVQHIIQNNDTHTDARLHQESAAPCHYRPVMTLNWEVCSYDNAPIFGTPCLVQCSPAPTGDTHDLSAQKTQGGTSSSILVYATVGGGICGMSPLSGRTVWQHTVVPIGADKCAIFSSPVSTAGCHMSSAGVWTDDSTLMDARSHIDMICHDIGDDCSGDRHRGISSNCSRTTWVLIGAHDGCVRAIDACTGELVWTVCVGSVVFAAPQIITAVAKCDASASTRNCMELMSDIIIVVCTTAGDICVISRDMSNSTGGDVVCTSSPEWQVLARHKLRGEIFASPVFVPSNMIPGDDDNDANVTSEDRLCGHIYIGCRDDCLHCVELTF